MQDSQPQQLSLGVTLNVDASLENFYIPPRSANAQAVFALRQQLTAAGEPYLFLWGGDGVGLSHLLQGACKAATAQGYKAQYVPLRELVMAEPRTLLNNLESMDLVCLDDLQVVIGSRDWEEALFGFFNSMRDCGRHLLIAADCSPHQLQTKIADVKSRLSSGLTFQIKGLDDEGKRVALQQRAKEKGLELPDEVSQFILHRAARSLHELFAVLNQLDDASLAEQRRLTIPFVKQILNL